MWSSRNMAWRTCQCGWLCFTLFLTMALLSPLGLGGPASSPLLPGQPFMVMWGVPDKGCLGRPDPATFGMEWAGRVAVFYEDTMGLYPYFTAQNQPINGGLPQHTSLDLHLQRVERDLLDALPQEGAPGLGVLRWEEWAPQWQRNRGKLGKYQDSSRALLRGFFPDWTTEEVEKWAQVDFEAASQAIIMETLREVKRLRPQSLWGMAPYPNCYNSGLAQLTNYTGRCPAGEMALNDELIWLWKQSSALYPILSLDKLQPGTKGAWLYTSNQIREALRLAALAGTAYDLPVFPLVKMLYSSTGDFLSEADLVNSVGESAAMGAAGVIIWERNFSVKNQKSCAELADFVREVLGPYVVNVTTAVRLCGVSLCQGRGRCIRKNLEDPVYLHLPSSFRLLPERTDGVRPVGELDPIFLETWKRDFHCQFYEVLEGAIADQESGGPEVRTPSSPATLKPPSLNAQSAVTLTTVAPKTMDMSCATQTTPLLLLLLLSCVLSC
ncbi:hyaluronidase-1 [Denticeps clupeoides]|uniref:Hyaluronidase n=1 Tax=Denticeps clupeoides TaxID=299321 RepID=A0AAY4DTY9_9TELE|nr:hyaluronidase-1-like [Denticeps clupeoides]XP_028850388.1 hyaluronidase-1-like [Denticeps clupeoides]